MRNRHDDIARGGSHRRRVSAWQKSTAIIPLALLTGAWAVAISGGGLAPASSDQPTSPPVAPEVPGTAFEVPASVQMPGDEGLPSGVDPHAGPTGTVSSLSTNGIPTAALLAYQHAARILEQADASCGVDWPLIAAIGRVESDHGRYGGNVLGADGVSRPGIIGIPLDGTNNTAVITDTDGGELDGDTVWDRAVGPMQFIPGTWSLVSVDGDDDGEKNPQDIDDAALATGVYLCAGEGDLSEPAGERAAVLRYNHSDAYADLVIDIATAYRDGDYTMISNDYTSPAVLTSRDNDYSPIEQPDREPRERGDKDKKDGSGRPADDGIVDTGDQPDSDGDNDQPDGEDNGGDDGNGGNKPGDGGDKPRDEGKPKPPTEPEEPKEPKDDDPGKQVEDTVEETVDPLEKATDYCQARMSQAGLSADEIAEHLGTCTTAYLDGGEDAAEAAIAGIKELLKDVLDDDGGLGGGIGG